MLVPILDADARLNAVHRGDILLGQHVLRRATREYMRVPQHQQAVAEERGEVEVVDGEEDGDALPLCNLRDGLQDEELIVEVEARRRLVEDDARVSCASARAIKTRWRSPPLISLILRRANGSSSMRRITPNAISSSRAEYRCPA